MSGASGVLYHHCFSPPSRMALLTIRNLGLNIQIKNIDIYKGEQNSPQYLKINPLNQVPAYVEGNFLLAESKAIATYLANSSKSFLYPTDCKKRALIDAKLYYDTANSFPAVRNFVVTQISIKPIVNKTYETFQRPVLRSGVKIIAQQTRDDVSVILGKLNSFLEKSEWFAGDELSLADIGFLSSVGTIKVCFFSDNLD